MSELTITEISKLIAAGESETQEFKESFDNEALETIGAFSNARGGVILVGVQDSGKVCGYQIGRNSLEDIANRIQTVADPRIQPSISIATHAGKKILEIQVTKNTGVPVSVRGRFYRRSGRTNQRMSHEEIMQCMVKSTGLSWDAYVEPGTSFKDLDTNLIDRFFQAANKIGRRPVPVHATQEAFLRKLELIKDGTITRAALLLFGKNTDAHFPSAFLKIGRFRTPTVIVDDREVHGSLINQLDGAMSWFRDRLTTKFNITGKPEREVHWEYPLNAIREGVINLLSHRDYTNGAHSQIRLYDDRLELWNAGTLPAPLTPDVLFKEHDSMPRNRKIAEVFFYMGLIERWGSGTIRIAEELENAGLPIPEFYSEAGRFKLTFYKQFLTEERLNEMGLSDRQCIAIAYLREHGTITNTDYQGIASVAKRTATRDLNELTSKGILIAEGGSRGRGKCYRLKMI